MGDSYEGVLRDNHIEWQGKSPQHLPDGEGVRVRVTILDEETGRRGENDRGARMAAALERIAAGNALGPVPDPAQWERDIRQDRPLPGRE